MIDKTIRPIPSPPLTVEDELQYEDEMGPFLDALPGLAEDINEFSGQVNALASSLLGLSVDLPAAQTAAAAAIDAAQQTAADKSAAASSASAAAASAHAAGQDAEDARAAATAAGSAKTASETALNEVLAAKTETETAVEMSTAKAAEATTSAQAAGQSSGDAEAAATTAVAAKAASETARDEAVAAINLTLAGRDAAVDAAEVATLRADAADASATAARQSELNAAQSAAAASEAAAGNMPAATTDTAGKIKTATTALTQAGTDTTTAVTPGSGAASYAPISKGVTNGDAHDHSGGDGAQIAYTSLSGLPTIPTASSTAPAALGTAAAGSGTTFARADHVHAMPTAANVGALASGADINLSDYKVQRPYFQDWAEVVNARGSISGAQTINLELGNVVTATITGATQIAFSNPPATGRAGGFVLVLTNGGASVVTWSSLPKWAAGTAPTLTASGVDILAFQTVDAGTTWRGILVAKDVK